MARAPEEQEQSENRVWEPTGGGGPGGFGGAIQFGFAVTRQGFLVRTGSRLFRIGSRAGG